LFYHLDRFAFELDLIDKCYSQLVTTAPTPDTEKVPFTDDEVNRIWQLQDEPWMDTVLIFLYTGFRISELLALRSENVDLDAGTMKGGTKSAAGKNRIVPIHSRLARIVQNRLSEGSEYLLSYRGSSVSVTQYRRFWGDLMKKAGMTHTPHECRHTFRSRLDSAGANSRCIDLLMGHKSKGVGERVYTHKTIEELREAIELITH
jgi:integrase